MSFLLMVFNIRSIFSPLKSAAEKILFCKIFPGSSAGRVGGCARASITSECQRDDMKVEKRTYADRRQYLIRAVKARRKRLRSMSVAYKGGKCQNCGYDRCMEAFEFHHTDSTQKGFGLPDGGFTRSWSRIKNELEKCHLLCANCHREIHAKLAASSSNAGMKNGLSQGNRTKSC